MLGGSGNVILTKVKTNSKRLRLLLVPRTILHKFLRTLNIKLGTILSLFQMTNWDLFGWLMPFRFYLRHQPKYDIRVRLWVSIIKRCFVMNLAWIKWKCEN